MFNQTSFKAIGHAVLAASMAAAMMQDPAQAQSVFIPDPAMRTWLNNSMPGVVDPDGYMDTASPAIAAFTNGALTSSSSSGPYDLTGLQYLHGLTDLTFNALTDVATIPGLPENLTHFEASLFGTVQLPTLPAGLEALSLASYTLNVLPVLPNSIRHLKLEGLVISSMLSEFPDSLRSLELNNLPLITALPQFPPGLSTLHISTLPLASLPGLPAALRTMQLMDLDLLNTIPSLPAGLDTLIIHSIPGLMSVPALPPELVLFHYLRPAPEATIPDLPQGLRDLCLSEVHGTAQCPVLPDGLVSLSMSYLPFGLPEQLPYALQHIYARVPCIDAHIPALPPGLRFLFLAEHWSVSHLPQLPDGLETLLVTGFPELQAIPELPQTLSILGLGECPNLACLPELPDGLVELTITDCSINCLPSEPQPWTNTSLDFDPSNICPDPCQLTGPYAAGRVYNDLNMNDVLDTGDHPLRTAMVSTSDGAYISGVDPSGHFKMRLTLGADTLSAGASTPYAYSCHPFEHALLFSSAAELDTAVNFAITLEAGHADIVADIIGSDARPGNINTVWLRVTNAGSEPQSSEALFSFSPLQELVDANPSPADWSNGSASWHVGELLPGEAWSARVTLITPLTVQAGTVVTGGLLATASLPDESPLNNQATLTRAVSDFLIPTDKLVEPDHLTLAQLASGDPLTYTIRFRNIGPQPVQHVRIMDNLDHGLLWRSFRLIGSSHPCNWSILGGTLMIDLPSINLPDSVTNEPESSGFVRFEVLPSPSLTAGSLIPNSAAVFFDNEPAMLTNEVNVSIGVVADSGDPAVPENGVLIHPNPAYDRVRISLPTEGACISNIKIFTTTGSLLWERTEHINGTWIDIGELPPGPYILHVIVGQATWISRLIVQ